MKFIKYSLYAIFLILASGTLIAQERRALVVGIGQYEDLSWNEINADNDLWYVEKVLEMYDFRDVTYLKNENATKASIVESFQSLITRSEKGDVIYVHFSGHGQQVKDLDGDEADGYDESWIPYDAYRRCCAEDDGSKHLIDDEINTLLSKLRCAVGNEGQILVIVDACHSGKSSKSGLNEINGFNYRGVGDIFIPQCKYEQREIINEDWLLIAACKDNQVNFEVKKLRVGKLTYSLYKLREFLPILSNDGLMRMINELMESDAMASPLPQTPHFDGGQYKVMDVFKR